MVYVKGLTLSKQDIYPYTQIIVIIFIEVEEGRILQISGDRSVEKEEKNDKWHRV